jgi:hypothetical protein
MPLDLYAARKLVTPFYDALTRPGDKESRRSSIASPLPISNAAMTPSHCEGENGRRLTTSDTKIRPLNQALSVTSNVG